MAKYSNTKAKINEKITTNSAQAITGNVLNEVLQTMVDSLGADYQFGGLVQPGSTFTAGEQPVVFLATTPGTYTNFGGIVVADGEVALLVWSGTAWSKQTPDIATRTEVSQLGQKTYHDLLDTFSVKDYIYNATNGVYTNSPTDRSTPLIPILGNIHYNCYLGGGTYPLYGIVFFDENRQFINQSYYGTSPGFQSGELDITDTSKVPANAKYFSCVIFSNHLDKNPYAYSNIARVVQDVVNLKRMDTSLVIDKEESRLDYESSTDETGVYITGFTLVTSGSHFFDIYGIAALASATGKTVVQSPSGKSSVIISNTELLVIRTANWSVKIISRNAASESDILLAACQVGRITEGELYIPKTKSIRVVPVDANNFDLFIPQLNNGKVLRHRFTRQQYTRTLNYGDGNTKSVECANIWYPSAIYNNEQEIVQGNLNFIYRLRDTGADFVNENDHVGAGHGGEVMDFQLFYADGKPFIPGTSGEMKCEVFRIVCKSFVYAIDTTQPGYVQGSDTLKLTEDGDKILTAIHTYDASFYVNNRIVWDNRLAIKRDNVVFMEANGAMCQGQYPAFNRVSVCDDDLDTNDYSITYGTPPQITPIGGSKNLYTHQFSNADAVILTGNGLCVKQKMAQEGKQNSVQTYFYYNSGATRLKCYMLPVKGVWQYPNDYDTFNNGDVIRVHCEREIEVKDLTINP